VQLTQQAVLHNESYIKIIRNAFKKVRFSRGADLNHVTSLLNEFSEILVVRPMDDPCVIKRKTILLDTLQSYLGLALRSLQINPYTSGVSPTLANNFKTLKTMLASQRILVLLSLSVFRSVNFSKRLGFSAIRQVETTSRQQNAEIKIAVASSTVWSLIVGIKRRSVFADLGQLAHKHALSGATSRSKAIALKFFSKALNSGFLEFYKKLKEQSNGILAMHRLCLSRLVFAQRSKLAAVSSRLLVVSQSTSSSSKLKTLQALNHLCSVYRRKEDQAVDKLRSLSQISEMRAVLAESIRAELIPSIENSVSKKADERFEKTFAERIRVLAMPRLELILNKNKVTAFILLASLAARASSDQSHSIRLALERLSKATMIKLQKTLLTMRPSSQGLPQPSHRRLVLEQLGLFARIKLLRCFQEMKCPGFRKNEKMKALQRVAVLMEGASKSSITLAFNRIAQKGQVLYIRSNKLLNVLHKRGVREIAKTFFTLLANQEERPDHFYAVHLAERAVSDHSRFAGERKELLRPIFSKLLLLLRRPNTSDSHASKAYYFDLYIKKRMDDEVEREPIDQLRVRLKLKNNRLKDSNRRLEAENMVIDARLEDFVNHGARLTKAINTLESQAAIKNSELQLLNLRQSLKQERRRLIEVQRSAIEELGSGIEQGEAGDGVIPSEFQSLSHIGTSAGREFKANQNDSIGRQGGYGGVSSRRGVFSPSRTSVSDGLTKKSEMTTCEDPREVEEARERYTRLYGHKLEVEATLRELMRQKDSIEADLESLTQRAQAFERNKEALHAEQVRNELSLIDLEDRRSTVMMERTGLNSQKNRLKEEVEMLKIRIGQTEESNERRPSSKKELLDHFTREISKIFGSISECSDQIVGCDQALAQIAETQKKVTVAISAAKDEAANFSEAISHLGQDIKRTSSNLEALRKGIEAKTKELEDLHIEVEIPEAKNYFAERTFRKEVAGEEGSKALRAIVADLEARIEGFRDARMPAVVEKAMLSKQRVKAFKDSLQVKGLIQTAEKAQPLDELQLESLRTQLSKLFGVIESLDVRIADCEERVRSGSTEIDRLSGSWPRLDTNLKTWRRAVMKHSSRKRVECV
jgi:hypothetical protein